MLSGNSAAWAVRASSRGAVRGVCGAVLLLACALPGCSKKKVEPSAAPSASASVSGPKPLSPELAAKTIAKVGDRVITLGEYAASLERMDPFERMRYQSPDRRKRLLDEMVEVELLSQEARRRGLDKTPETQERLRQLLRDQLLEEIKKSGPAANDVPEPELRAYYDAHKDEFAEPERRRVAAIVLENGANAKNALAKAVKASPADWGSLVDQYSTQKNARPAPSSPNELAGDLGIIGPPGHPRGANPRVPEPVRDAAFKIAAVGETFPSVVEADGKFYIVRVTSKTDGRERKYEESQCAIRTAVVQARIRDKEQALEKDLRQRFPVKVDQAALSAMPMPAPSPSTAQPSFGSANRPPLGMPRMPGLGGPPGPGGPPPLKPQ